MCRRRGDKVSCVCERVCACLPVYVYACVCLHAQSNRTKPPHRKCKTGRGKKEGRAKREATEAKGKTEVREQEENNINILGWEVRAPGRRELSTSLWRVGPAGLGHLGPRV